MKEKIITLLMLSLLIIMPLSIAQETATITRTQTETTMQPETTPIETELIESIAFTTSNGAQMRMMQLARALHRNIISGEAMFQDLYEELDEEQILHLKRILSAMIELRDEIRNYEYTTLEQDLKRYLEYREQAKRLTERFRYTLHENLNTEKINTLRTRTEEINKEELKEYEEKINEKRKAHNEEILTRSIKGIVQDDLIERIRTQDIDVKEIREQVLLRVREQQQERAETELERLREEAMKQREKLLEEQQRLREEAMKQREKLLEERLTRATEKIPELITAERTRTQTR